MARKAATPQARRRQGVNRAQLKALAARQAMTASAVATRPGPDEDGDTAATATLDLAAALPRARRRPTLTREEEFAFIRRDLVRLVITAACLLILMLIVLMVLR
ncbi:MAG TPA: hypothetical protein VFW96_00075 [Thermomicrobiales bacterium]|nr:hypothetical protein [Thermomicrobiales bacterium]